jgi:hypothetical protein
MTRGSACALRCTPVYRSEPLCTPVYPCAPLRTEANPCVPLCTPVHPCVLYRSEPLCTHVYPCVPLCTPACVPLCTHVYHCVPLCTPVYPRVPLRPVYPCVQYSIHLYPCVPLRTPVYPCVPSCIPAPPLCLSSRRAPARENNLRHLSSSDCSAREGGVLTAPLIVLASVRAEGGAVRL